MDIRYIVLLLSSTLLVLAAPSTIGSSETVWVVVGGRAELPCRPNPKRADDDPMLVLWYRTNNRIPIYTYDTRHGDFMEGQRWKDENVLGKRSYFIAYSDPPKLVLEPVHASDQGVYTCRVDYRLSSSTTVIVNLTVIIPPGPPQVLWRGRSVVGYVGPLGEGERTRLTCRSSGGRPSPVLTWLEGSRRLPLISANSTLDPVSGTFTAEASISVLATRELLDASLTCHAHTPRHAHIEGSPVLQGRSASVSLNITLPPQNVRILGSQSAVTEGATLRLVCHAYGSHPPSRLAWWRGEAALPDVTYAIEDGGNITTATMTILVNRQHDGATLTCTAANPALSVPPLTDTATLAVYYAPVVGLSLGRSMKADLIKEGDDAYFECNIEANPPFHRVDWRHNGVELVHNMSAGVVMNGLNLVLRNLQREQSGSYTCTAANNEGRVTSNAVLLSVRHVPVCAGAKHEKTQGAARGSTAAVKCIVEAEPADGIKWTWFRKRVDGSEEEIPEEDVRSDGLASSVLVTPHTPDDYGRFLCLATNDVGTQETACVVTLVPAGPPDAPTNCSVNPVKHSSHPDIATLAVNCLEGFDGGLPQKFLMEAWQEGVLKANVTSDFPEWVVKGLQTGVSVSLKVVAHNARGKSEPLTMEVHTTSAQHHAAPGFLSPDNEAAIDIPPIVGAALGLVAVLLLLIVVGVVLCRRMRPRPRKPTPAEVPLTPAAGVDGFDPDVVASIQRPPPGLDVIPCDQEDERDYEESYEHERFNTDDDEDILQAHATRHSCVHVHRTGSAGSREQVGQGMYVRGEGGPCSCVHSRGSRISHGASASEHNEDGQGTPNNDSQSYDSGVSESESDSELQVMAGGSVAAVIRQYPDSGRAYVTLSPGEALAQVTPDAEVRLLPAGHAVVGSRPPPLLEVQPTNLSPMEVRLKPFVSKEYKVSSVDAEGLRLLPSSCREVRLVPSSVGESRPSRSPAEPRVPSSVGELKVEVASHRDSRPPSSCAMRSPTSQAEVICLPISPAESSSSRLPSEKRPKEAIPKAAKDQLPSSARDAHVQAETRQHDVARPHEQLDLGRTVTLLHGEHGEVVFIPRKPSQSEGVRGSRQCTPVFPSMKVCDAATSTVLPDTLPKAVARESKAKALKRVREMERIDQDLNLNTALPLGPQGNPDGQTKLPMGARRSYHPRPHPDVCRRESSV